MGWGAGHTLRGRWHRALYNRGHSLRGMAVMDVRNQGDIWQPVTSARSAQVPGKTTQQPVSVSSPLQLKQRKMLPEKTAIVFSEPRSATLQRLLCPCGTSVRRQSLRPAGQGTAGRALVTALSMAWPAAVAQLRVRDRMPPGCLAGSFLGQTAEPGFDLRPPLSQCPPASSGGALGSQLRD